ncbi:PspC domain-containing protein [Micromonospora sp. NPDC000089]|uniref:PspC domain-containing protein n=1 Tax=unclassified Micromonospora TaxID=2617518 RepID=UPI0036B68870
MTEEAAPSPRPGPTEPGGAPTAPPTATGPTWSAPASPTGGDDAPPPPGGYPPPPSGGASFTSRYGLVRPREGRYLAGVCAAIGRATNTDPVLWRVILAVLGFFGGVGILVYVAAWLIIPGEGDSASPLESVLGRGRSSMSPVTVIVLSILVAVSFGYIVTDAFRAVLLGAAILIGGALLLNRDSHASAPPGQPYPAPPAAPPGPVPPVSWPAPDPFAPGPPAAAGAGAGVPLAGDLARQPAEPRTDELPTWSAPVGEPRAGDLPGPAPAGTGTRTEELPAWPVAGTEPRTDELPAWSPAGEPRTGEPPAWPAGGASPGELPGWSTAPGGQPGAGAAPLTVPPVPPGYRAPFAPRGPYAGTTPPPPAAPRPVRPPKRPRERSALGPATFSLIFLALGVVALLDLLDVFPVGAAGYFAAALATIGLGLLVGAWFGRARWLIALGLLTAVALSIATVAESYDRVRGMDDRVTWSPASHRDLATRYENSFGDATLDLRAVDFTERDTEVTVVVNFGAATVVVPPNVDVTAVTDVRAGDATVFGQHSAGVEQRNREVTDLGPDGAGGGKLRLYVHVNAGNLEVTR